MTEQSKSIATSYGTVDQQALEELRKTFDTARLRSAIEAIDNCPAGEVERPTLHASLRCLHDMARHLIDNAPMTVTSEQPIWQLAEEILDDIEERHLELSGVVAPVRALAALRPSDL